MTEHSTKGFKVNSYWVLIGALIVGLLTIFQFVNAVPWEPRGAVDKLRLELKADITEVKQDVKELRTYFLGPRRRDGERRDP